MVQVGTHKKGAVAPGKVNCNWRILEPVTVALKEEAIRQGFGEKGIAQYINNHFTRYFNGETMKRGS